MTVCAKQSVLLHRESVDNLHSIVDANIKVYIKHTESQYMYILSLSLMSLSQASYNFLAKFEELNRRTLPLSDLAQQMYPSNGEILLPKI